MPRAPGPVNGKENMNMKQILSIAFACAASAAFAVLADVTQLA